MKKTFVYPIAFMLLVVIIGCKKEQLGRAITPTQPNQSINANVATGETFTFVAGYTGSLSVSKQALHFEVSQTLNENGSVYYNYQPKAGYFGNDEVTLTYLSEVASPGVSTSSNCQANHDNASTITKMTTILIKLNVTK